MITYMQTVVYWNVESFDILVYMNLPSAKHCYNIDDSYQGLLMTSNPIALNNSKHVVMDQFLYSQKRYNRLVHNTNLIIMFDIDVLHWNQQLSP